MTITAYFWCLWGLCLCACINLTSGFSLWNMDGEIRLSPPVPGCFALLNMTKCMAKFQDLCHPERNRVLLNIIMGERNEKKEEIAGQKQNSVIHLTNNNIKLIYLYFAKNKYSEKTLKNHPIVVK